MRLTARRLASRRLQVAILVFLVVWLIWLRPAALDGSTTYVFVGGQSMLPTYEIGDLIVAGPASAYGPDMVVVYRIPDGESGAGRLVVHRITGGDAQAGFTTLGDHSSYTDLWHPRSADILGVPVAVIPKAGLVIQVLRQPLVAAPVA